MFNHVNPPESDCTFLITIDFSANSPPYDVPIWFCIPWRAMFGFDTLIDEALELSKFCFPNRLGGMSLYDTDVSEDLAVPLSSHEPEDEGQWAP
jgi:hypothetical protein